MVQCCIHLEKLDLRSLSDQVKIVGTLVSISGALILIVTLYKGPSIRFGRTTPSSSPPLPLSLTENNWILGGLFFAVASLSFSIWNTFQTVIVRAYPDEMTIDSFYTFFGTIQTAVLCLIAERDPSGLESRARLLFGSVITPLVITWCLEKKGPVFAAMFNSRP